VIGRRRRQPKVDPPQIPPGPAAHARLAARTIIRAMTLLCETRSTRVSIACLWLLQVVALTVVVIGATSVDGAQAESPSRTRSVYASALDGKGAAVAGLTAADLSIREDDKAQPILSVLPATAKMSIAVLVDDGGVGMGDFRLGIARFMNRLLGQATFSLVGIADQNRTLLEFTDNAAMLVSAVRTLQPRIGQPGQHLVAAVDDALAVAEKMEAVRPVVVVLTNQAHESDNRSVQTVMDRLARTAVVLHVVEVVRPSASSRDSGPGQDSLSAFSRDGDAAALDRARSQILGSGPTATGGRRLELVASTGAPAAMAAIAEELAGQYVIVFGSNAEADVLSKISISTTRNGVRLHAPARATSRLVR
jgi:VWFA-related protein